MDDTVAAIYRQESRRIFSTLVRLLGSFDLAEDALHDAFTAALKQWPAQGIPANPVAWLVSAGRFKGVDRLRRERLFVALDAAAEDVEAAADPAPNWEALHDDRGAIEDDRLRLVFTCCHPGLSEEARIALTLREVCGLTTEAIASAFLIAAPALAQRIVRAKAKIAAARIPYEVPGPAERPARLAGVLRVVYLVFTEGHAAHAAARADEAIRLARLLHALLPEPEVTGLLALLLLHDARRLARATPDGELIALEDQDRSRWNRATINEGCTLAQDALSRRGFGAYALQAAIAAVHAEAATAAVTDWPQIVGLYDALLRVESSPVIALNRAVAVGMRDGAEAGLALIAPLLPALPGYHAGPAAAADFCRRAGRPDEAATHYRAAVALARQEPERRWLLRRLAEVSRGDASENNFDAVCRIPSTPFDQRTSAPADSSSAHPGSDMTTTLTPYLAFPGTTREAFAFYAQALGAQIQTMMTFADMPAPPGPPPEGCGDAMPSGDGIMHACLVIPGGAMLFAGDSPTGRPYEGIKGNMLALQFATVDEAQRVFAALSAGGTVTMPLMPSFWSKVFGMVTDRFGVSWAVNGEPVPVN